MMKRIILLLSLVSLIFISNIEGAVPTRQYANTSGQVIDPDKVTSNEDVIYLYLQAGVEAYKDGSITGDDLISTIAISSSGNMTFSGTTNISGTFQLGGTTITATATNINNIAGLTASASELNIMDGATLSTVEINYVDGVTSAIQTQLDGKSATTGNASIVTVGTITTGGWAATAVPVAYGGTGATSAANARTNLGLGSIATQASNSVTITGGSITGITDLAIADGGTGASSFAAAGLVSLDGSGYVPDNSVDTSALKTATSEVTGTTTYANYTLTGGQYCFYPQVKMSSTNAQDWWATICHANGLTTFAGWTTYATNISLYAGSAGNIYAIARYVTSSGIDYWLWFWVDKSTKDILAIAGAPDHVAYGNGDDFEAMPHPFRDYNSDTQDVILIEKFQAKAIQLEAKEKHISVLDLVSKDYKIDFSKTYSYIPTHSGQYSPDEKPVLVKSIPDYIQVRKLIKR